jgi:hypothetical protein
MSQTIFFSSVDLCFSDNEIKLPTSPVAGTVCVCARAHVCLLNHKPFTHSYSSKRQTLSVIPLSENTPK